MLSIRGLRFGFDGAPLFEDLSLEVAAGGIIALIGANGAGKSSLMNCIAGLYRPQAGEIVVDGIAAATDIDGIRRRMGYLPDNFGLFPALSAQQHLQYAAAAHGKDAAAADAAADKAGVTELLHKTPAEMSRGQRQRLAIAMTLTHQPRFLLLDEPASGLDPAARIALSALIKQLHQDGATLLVSSHILTELRDYATEALIMDAGKIIYRGALTDGDNWRLVVAQTGAAQTEALLRATTGIERLRTAAAADNEVEFHFSLAAAQNDAGGTGSELLRHLVSAGTPVIEFSRAASDIEQLYMESVADAGKAQTARQ